MAAQEHHIRISKTARYYVLGNQDSSVQEVWFVCHGYGQLASFFIKHFKVLENSQRLIVAPEALSRFYLETPDRRVAATWMTKEDRINEIKDYVNYLDTLAKEILSKTQNISVKVTIFGFSQATATVCRWVAQGDIQPNHLILWAGRIPPELKLRNNKHIFKNAKLTFVIGDKDEYATPDIINEEKLQLEESGILFQFVSFTGGHQINTEVLKRISGICS